MVTPEARVSNRARAARAGPELSSRCAAKTAATSTKVLSTTQTLPSSTSCGASGMDGVTNCGKNARKKKRGFDVQGLDQNALAQGPGRAQCRHTRQRKSNILAPQQPHTQVHQIGCPQIFQQAKRQGRLSHQQR